MKIFLLLTVLFSFSAFSNAPDIITHFKINGGDNFVINPNAPTTIEVWYTDATTGDVLKDFKVMHGKIMHMLLIKKDLSEFKHIHPYLDPVTGIFQITINMPLADPDNYQTTNTLTKSGMFMVMADVDIRGYGMRMGHAMVTVKGPMHHHPLSIDPVAADMSINKTLKMATGEYKFKLTREATAGCGGELIEFVLTMWKKDISGDYRQIPDLQPWLSQGAHAVWASQNLMTKHKMHMVHMHAPLPREESEFIFSIHNKDIMKDGLQKMWVQIKHQDQVMTVPFTFEYAALGTVSCGG